MLETMLNGSLVEVSSLDAQWLLDFAADAEVRERQAGRAKLRAAAQWCVLHPATAESGFVTWSDTGLPGLCPDEEAALGGEGTPLVAAFTPEPFAAALGVSTLTGFAVVGRRPGPPTPTPEDLGRRRSAGGGAVEGPQDRPGHPPPVPGRRRVGGRPAGGPDRVVWVAGDRDRGRPGHRHLRPAPAGDPGEARQRRVGGPALHRGVGTDGGDDWAGTSHLEVTGDTLDLNPFTTWSAVTQAAQLESPR